MHLVTFSIIHGAWDVKKTTASELTGEQVGHIWDSQNVQFTLDYQSVFGMHVLFIFAAKKSPNCPHVSASYFECIICSKGDFKLRIRMQKSHTIFHKTQKCRLQKYLSLKLNPYYTIHSWVGYKLKSVLDFLPQSGTWSNL